MIKSGISVASGGGLSLPPPLCRAASVSSTQEVSTASAPRSSAPFAPWVAEAPTRASSAGR
eukprot:scaffold5808_cov128-Isochrysis_galbana.AAC.30